MTIATTPPLLQAAEASSVPECPYVGLVPFGEQEAPFFFGREREAETIIANLTAARLTLLYAPSGVGKSSVLRAGVLPQLRRRAAEDAEDDLEPTAAAVAYVSDWSTNPLETAAAAIRQAVAPVIDTAEAPDAATARLGLDWLRELLRDAGVTVLYLVLDQFEEYFFYHHAADPAADPLVAALGDILASREVNVHMLLSVREDALAGLDRFKGQVPHLFGNYLRLEHLNRDAARSAIEGPLVQYNRAVCPADAVTVEPGLVEDILDQVRAGNVRVDPEGTSTAASDLVDSGLVEAPYLQLVLTRIWEQEITEGSHVLRQATLAELGGAQTVVSSHLDTVVAGLAPEQVPVAAACLRHLVTASGSKIALTAMDLADWSGQPEDDVERLLESLASGPQRILRPVPPAAGLSAPPRYEIFHDVMGTAVLAWRRRYLAKAHLEKANKRLVVEREQAQAEAMTARRKLRFTRMLIASLLVILLVIAGAGWKIRQDWLTRQQLEKLAEAKTALLHDPAQSLTAAVAAFRLGDTTETRSAVLAAASAPRSSVVTGPNPASGMTLQRMKTTPDGRHVLAYDSAGRFVVVDDAGRKQVDMQVVGLRGAVVDVAPAPDAGQVAVATDKGEVSIVDVQTGRRADLATGLSVDSEVFWLSTPAGSRVLVRGSDHSATLFNPGTGAVTARLPGQFSEVASLDAGSRVVTSPWGNGPLRVWDAATGSPLAQSEAFTPAPDHLTQDGTKIVGIADASDGSKLVIWDWHSAKPPVQTTFYPHNLVRTVTVNPVQHIVLVAFDKTVEEFRTDDGQAVLDLPQQADWVNDATTSTDGDWALTAGADGRLLVWYQHGAAQPAGPTYELQGDGGTVWSAAFVGNSVLALEGNGTMRRWDLPRSPRFHANNWVNDLALSPDQRELASASSDGYGYILDPTDVTHQFARFGDGSRAIYTVRFDPTDPHRVIELGLYADAPQLWQWSNSTPSTQPITFEAISLGDFNSLNDVAVSPDGNTVVAGDYAGGLHYWDIHTGRLLHDRDQPGDGYPASLVFDPSGRYFAVTVRGGIRLTGPDGTQRTLSLPNATTVAFDGAGDRVAAAADGGEVKVWSTSGASDAPLQDYNAHSNRLTELSFSQDGSLLTTGTADGLVEVVDVRTGVTVALVRQHGDSVNAVVFAPGGNTQLISASDDLTVAEWPCAACGNQEAAIRAAVDATPEH